MFRRFSLFFFNDTATTEIYTLSLHDALPICACQRRRWAERLQRHRHRDGHGADRKSTRLNSSHVSISYAVFCLKKKKRQDENISSNQKHGRIGRADERRHHLCLPTRTLATNG